MAWTVISAFEEFFENINLLGDHREIANTRRDDVVKILKKKLNVIESFNSGSIHRFTALKNYADLDIIAALHYTEHIKGKSPTEVLQSVRDALGEYRTNVRKNGQAVTLHYKTWPNVDIVPASRLADNFGNVTGYSIPDMNTGSWISTNPKTHSLNVENKSKICGGSFRKIVKMIKWWNKKHSDYLQSYHIEVMALKAFDSFLNNITWDVFNYFDKASVMAQTSLWYDQGYVDGYLNYSSRQEAIKRLEAAKNRARDAWYLTYKDNNDHKGAINKWKVIFGDKFPSYG